MSPVGWLAEVGKYLLAAVGGAGVLWVVLKWAAENPSQAEKLAKSAWSHLSWAFRDRAEYEALRLDIQSTVNEICEGMETEAPGVMPFALEIEWVRDDVSEALRQDAEILVKMNREMNDDRNIAVATMEYLSQGLLPVARRFLDVNLREAVKLTVGRKILLSCGLSEYSYFAEKFREPILCTQPAVRRDCSVLEDIEEGGFFTRIYLRDIKGFGDQLEVRTPTEGMYAEARQYTDFLHWIATRRPGDEAGELTFTGQVIRTAVILCIRDETRYLHGTKAHEQRVVLEIAKGARALYIVAIGEENINIAKAVASLSKQVRRIKVMEQYDYATSRPGYPPSPAIVIACEPVGLRPDGRMAHPSDIVYVALEREVRKVRDGHIEIMEVAREPGISTKVVVRSLDPRISNPAESCSSKIKSIRKYLPDEWVGIINYSDDLEALVVDALFPLPPEKVVTTSLDSARNRVYVSVEDGEAYSMAAGAKGVNVRLAEQVCGADIELVRRT